MEFKIDTKPNYTVIEPVSTDINAELTELLSKELEKCKQNGSHNFIINFHSATNMQVQTVEYLLKMHQMVYEQGGSLVFTGLNEYVLQVFKKEQLHLSLNLTPTLIEAIDIVNMEELERDLLKEL